jgi:FixJ family two-component response regulator
MRTTAVVVSTRNSEVKVSCADGVVYLIDDDAAFREGLADLLASYGVSVVSFTSSREFMSYKRVESAACLLLDLHLPDVNGLDLQSHLTEERALPIIFMSGRGDIASSVKAMKGGAVEFLTKPMDSAVLLNAIREAWQKDEINRREWFQLAELRERLARLSPREREVLPLIVQGVRTKQAAFALGVAEVTLQLHRSRIIKKMEATSVADLVKMATRLSIY